jgi:hypothetical protein
MTDKSKFANVADMSYRELLKELQEEFSISKRVATQIIAIVCDWLES